MKTRVAAAAAAISLCASAGVWWLIAGNQDGPLRAAAHLDESSAEGRRASAKVKECQLTPGYTVSYRFESEARAQLDAHALAGLGASDEGPQGLNQRLSGTLDVSVLVPGEAGAVALAQLRDMTGAGAASVATLTPSFLVRINTRCKITAFARHKNTEKVNARTQQAIVHELLWTLPDDDRGEDSGENATGQYAATFVRHGDQVVRHIDRYSRLWAEGFASPRREPIESRMTVTRDPHGWFLRLDGFERLEGVTPLATVARVFAEKVATPARALSQVSRNPDDYVWENLLPVVFRSKVVSALRPMGEAERQRYEKQTLDVAVTEFAERVETRGAIAQTWPAMTRFIEAKPEQARPFLDRALNGELSQKAIPLAFVALGNAQVPEARDALLHVLHDSSAPVIHRARSAFALVPRTDVGVPLAESLASYSQAITAGPTRDQRLFARESLLALGMMGGLLAQNDLEVKAVATTAVLRQLGASDALALRPALSALANIGDHELLDSVTRFTFDRDEKIREAAAIVVRRMDPKLSEDFTARWLQREKDGAVKRKLYDVLRRQLHDAHAVVSPVLRAIAADDLLRGQLDLPSRQSIIKMLIEVVKHDPEDTSVRAILRAQLKVELVKKSGLASLILGVLDSAEVAPIAATLGQQEQP